MGEQLVAPAADLVRFFVGTPHEDDRTRHARLAGILLLLGAVGRVWVCCTSCPSASTGSAVGLGRLCLIVGEASPGCPGHRWPYIALISPLVLAFPVCSPAAVGGDLDYYALYFPLLFIYCGYTFPPRYTGWMFLLSLLGLSLTTLTEQPAGTVPFVLLGSLLAAVCGVVLALQRQDEQRGQESMRQLVEAASALAPPSTRSRWPASSRRPPPSCLDAYGVAVLLPTAHGDDTVVSAAEGCLTAAGAEGESADADLLALLRHGAPPGPTSRRPPSAGPPAASGRTSW
jgi:hypothetical protein